MEFSLEEEDLACYLSNDDDLRDGIIQNGIDMSSRCDDIVVERTMRDLLVLIHVMNEERVELLSRIG